MVKKGYWTILPFSAVAAYPHLKLSPCGMVPQRNRQPRPIIDYSYTPVNNSSLPIAPYLAMQMGHALQRILQQIAYANPDHGPPLLTKFDLADGYYRIKLMPEAVLELAVILSGLTDTTSLVSLPLCLPMGWCNSPPFFCAFTEMAADIANTALAANTLATPHPLSLSSQDYSVPRDLAFHPHIVHPPTIQRGTPPIAFLDVYIDDFIGIAQRPRTWHALNVTLNAISSIFHHDAHPNDKPSRKATISASKINKRDGAWTTSKVVLVWLLNTAAGTLQLPEYKVTAFKQFLQSFANLHRTSQKHWYSLLSQLCNFAGAAYLFSIP
jgi:hypothetical protein